MHFWKCTLSRATPLVFGASGYVHTFDAKADVQCGRAGGSCPEAAPPIWPVRPPGPRELDITWEVTGGAGGKGMEVWDLAGVWGSGMSANACPLPELGSLTSLGRAPGEQGSKVWRSGGGGWGLGMSLGKCLFSIRGVSHHSEERWGSRGPRYGGVGGVGAGYECG